MRPGDRVHAVRDLYSRTSTDEVLVPCSTLGTVDQTSMFGRSALVDYDNGVCLRHRSRCCQTQPHARGTPDPHQDEP